MKTIINTSYATDYSGETPIVTYSNPVTTVIRQDQPAPIITRYFYCLCCDCCRSCCNCCCGDNF
ncbi:MAG: hypothetical protein K2G44_01105 [Clostridia bacterium]|nr:hypothetical protein [Clostridia bacterium]